MQRLGSLPFLSGTNMELPFARSKLCLSFPSNALGRTKMRLSRVEFLNIRRKEAAFGGQSSARLESRRLLLGELPLRGAASGGAPAARGCSIEEGRRLLLGELALRGAVRWRGKGGCFWGSSRCAGLLLDGGGKEALSRGVTAARGCPIAGGRRRLLLGGGGGGGVMTC